MNTISNILEMKSFLDQKAVELNLFTQRDVLFFFDELSTQQAQNMNSENSYLRAMIQFRVKQVLNGIERLINESFASLLTELNQTGTPFELDGEYYETTTDPVVFLKTPDIMDPEITRRFSVCDVSIGQFVISLKTTFCKDRDLFDEFFKLQETNSEGYLASMLRKLNTDEMSFVSYVQDQIRKELSYLQEKTRSLSEVVQKEWSETQFAQTTGTTFDIQIHPRLMFRSMHNGDNVYYRKPTYEPFRIMVNVTATCPEKGVLPAVFNMEKPKEIAFKYVPHEENSRSAISSEVVTKQIKAYFENSIYAAIKEVTSEQIPFGMHQTNRMKLDFHLNERVVISTQQEPTFGVKLFTLSKRELLSCLEQQSIVATLKEMFWKRYHDRSDKTNVNIPSLVVIDAPLENGFDWENGLLSSTITIPQLGYLLNKIFA